MSGRPTRSFGSYELLGELGRGAFGRVLHARHRATGAERAVKVVLASATAEARERFRREVEILTRVDGHPNLVRIHEAIEVEGQLAYVMELVRGPSLRKRLDSERRLSPGEAARIVLGLARALDHCHRAGVLHRDVKPENVLLDEAGTPKLADLGLARCLESSALTKSGTLMGTPRFMAPELFNGERATAASEVYALGCVLFEAVSGQPTVTGHAFHEVAFQIAKGLAPLRSVAPDAPPALETICTRALRFEPAARYPSAAALAADLELFLAGKPLAADAPSRGRVIGAAVAAAVAALIVVALVAAATFSARAPVSSDPKIAPVASASGTALVTSSRGGAPVATAAAVLEAKERGRALRAELTRIVEGLERLESVPPGTPPDEADTLLHRLVDAGKPFEKAPMDAPPEPLTDVWDRLLEALLEVFFESSSGASGLGLTAEDLARVASLPVADWHRSALLGVLGELVLRGNGPDEKGRALVRPLLNERVELCPSTTPRGRLWRVLFLTNRARLLAGPGGPHDSLQVAEDGEKAVAEAEAAGHEEEPFLLKPRIEAGAQAGFSRLARASFLRDRHDLARSREELGRAEEDLEGALEAGPADTGADFVRLDLAIIEGAKGQWAKARAALEELHPGNPEIACRVKSLIALAAAMLEAPDAEKLAAEALAQTTALVESKGNACGATEAYEAAVLVEAHTGKRGPGTEYERLKSRVERLSNGQDNERLHAAAYNFISDVLERLEALERAASPR